MASIYISCPSFAFSCHSDHSKKSRKFSGFHTKVYSRKPKTKVVTTNAPVVVRRTANYPPTQWSYGYLQTLTTNYTVENYERRLHSLKERVRTMIFEDTAVENPLSILELVDDLQRLGISYHFQEEIESVLKMIYKCHYEAHENWKRMDLNLKALGFRLLRQHGYHIPQEIFEDIKDESGNIKAGVCEDIVGMLNLYEASFLAVEDENILDKAREFTSNCLKDMLENKRIVDQSMLMLTSHALELPLLWSIQRFEAIWFIETYKNRKDMKPLLLELASLDFNIVQGIHQEDLKYSSRWWDGLGWNKKLSFARDRLVESFMWAVGASYEPSFALQRRHIAKCISLVNVIDDVYDVYGTLDELEQFTDVVRRWDINGIEELPDYMKICFLGFFNTINDMVYNTLTNQESLVMPYVKNAWVDYCEANLIEARWFNAGYIPTLEEYLKNSCTTVSLPVVVLSAYFCTSSDTIAEDLHYIIHLSAMILRLADDLGTSSAELKRGDVPKAVQCYMHETGVSEEEGKAYVKKLIMETWKKLNKERMAVHSSSSSRLFVECATNLGRMGQFTYQRGDMFGSPDDLYISHQSSLLFNPKS